MEHQNIEQTALNTFQENLLFLQTNNPKLFEKINNLSQAIEKHYYHERYSLEYIHGYFDVLETDTGKWLYGSDSNKHADLAAKSVDFTKEGNLFETFLTVDFSKESIQELSASDVTEHSLASTAELVYYSNTHASKHTTTMKKLYKFIFLGTGLGLHIRAIHEKIHAYVYFIIEDDLELFRLSLFTTNYARIAQEAKIIFSVFEEDREFQYSFHLFFEELFFYNHYLKFFNILSHSPQKLRTMQNDIAGLDYLTFNFSAVITTFLRPLEHLAEGYPFLNIHPRPELSACLKNRPVLILGAGPSFQKNTEWIRTNHSRFVIVAVSALLSKLEELEIKPDIICHIDGFSITLSHLEKIKEPAFFAHTLALLGTFTQSAFAHFFPPENVYFIEGASEYKPGFGRHNASNVGAFAYGLMLRLNASSVYLLGLDFALDQESGHTHADAHAFGKQLSLEESTEVGGAIEYGKTIIKTKGNFAEEVFTTLPFEHMRQECNLFSVLFKTSGHNVYNLSEGASINETDPLRSDEIDTAPLPPLDKEALYRELHSHLDAQSGKGLTPTELGGLHNRILYCQKLVDILTVHIQMPHPTLDDFHRNMLTTFRNLLALEGDEDIKRILLYYIRFVSGFVFDLINTREIEYPKKMIKYVNKSVIPKMIRIVSHIQKELQKHYEEESKKAGEKER